MLLYLVEEKSRVQRSAAQTPVMGNDNSVDFLC